MRKLLIGLAAAATAVVIATPSIAQAASRTIPDTVGDIHYGMDIKTASVSNGKPLSITIKHRAISEGSWSGVYIDVTPGHGNAPDFFVRGGIGGDYQLSWMNGWKIGGWLGCPGPGDYHQYVSYKYDTTRFTLARSCLDGASFRATKVRVIAVAGRSGHTTDWAPGYHRWSEWIAYQ